MTRRLAPTIERGGAGGRPATKRRRDGEEIVDREGEQAAEVPDARRQPLPPVWPQPRLHAQVRGLPDLLPRAGLGGSPAGRHQVELVGKVEAGASAMSVNDPISDMLTRIRNAGMARKA